MDEESRRDFKKYVVVLFCGSIFAVLGVGSVIPFISVLIQPEKIMSLHFFQGWTYAHVILLFTFLLIAAFALKNIAAVLLLRYQSNFFVGRVS